MSTRTIPTFTVWTEAVDTVNYAKGTKDPVAKATKTLVPKQGAQPLFHYINRHERLGDWYLASDLQQLSQPVKKAKSGPVKTTKAGFTAEQLATIAKLQELGVL